MTEAYIKSITYGVYQLKQCVPYTISHLEQNADYVCEFYGENEELVRVKIKSRFSSQLIHNTWIKYSTVSTMDPIQELYCDCKADARVFGASSHVTSIIWYLGIGHNRKDMLVSKKSENLFNFCLDCDKKDLVENDLSLIRNENEEKISDTE
ncbi:Vacuolar sorting-associated 13C [Brachionus plicatilis]|uniref:Vacuolar sorting-associated 13C n=1 Tax=Brachionus plicatilis TaxID=10195 RepID=A0A3M7PK76_BRAPC|nr:Vacuolar sorting-associated 13C [Brachionus plicatilis]